MHFEVAQPIHKVEEATLRCFGIGRTRRGVDQLHAADEGRRHEKAGRVNDKGHLHAKDRRGNAAQQRAQGKHCAPGEAVQCVGNDEFVGLNHIGKDGRVRRVVEGAERELQRGERIEEPDLAGVTHQQKAEHRSGAQQVGGDQNRAPVDAIGEYAGKGRCQEDRQEARQKEKTDG